MSPKTLVVAPSRLADALPRLPVFAALARSGRVVVGLFREGQEAFEPTLLRYRKEFAPAALNVPVALPWGGHEGTRPATLRRLAFNEAIVLEPGLGTGLLTLRANIAERWAYVGGPGDLFARMLLNRQVRRPAELASRPWREREKELLEAMGLVAEKSEENGRLDVPRGWTAVGREQLERAKIEPSRKVIGIYLGHRGGGMQGDGWPRASFEELIRGLRQARSDYQIVLIAQLEDLWQAVLLYEKTGKIHPVLGPDLPFTGQLATLTTLDLLIAADSALLHLAGALGVPTLGLYEKEAALRRPPGSRHRQLESRPLRTLQPETVKNAALELLAEV